MKQEAQANNQRWIFFISDSTGITVETLGRSLLTQFDSQSFHQTTLRYVDSPQRVQEACEKINQAARETGLRPIVFSTLVDAQLREVLSESEGLIMDFMAPFVAPLAQELGVAASEAVGQSHGVKQETLYTERIDAVNFALQHDDGMSTQNYSQAEIILTGVSRSGKTPTCLYLALHYGIYAANYPLVEEDLATEQLPVCLKDHKEKLFGLTIAPERLHGIRTARKAGSRYASLEQCRTELRQAESLYRVCQLHYLDVTTKSVEEIATNILQDTALKTHDG